MEFAEGVEVLAGAGRIRGTLLHEEKPGVWTVQLGSIRMSIKEKDMQLIKPAGFSGAADYSVELNKSDANGSPLFELRLLGMREEEAMKALQRQLDLLHAIGIADVIVDPGFGFAKSIDQNYQLLGRLPVFRQLRCPLLVGISRKTMIWAVKFSFLGDSLSNCTIRSPVLIRTFSLYSKAYLACPSV